ncbi:hypothetical protein [Parvularcula marina]|uniref:Uncharacterized protein n=1 Tax=Parvularcula marina TaxID=2292771 RepID=A0A371RGT0_9PROT|nr:hypothetical protein [Parvularcula marina]RFB04625.1 hypothetical protein DX908_04620 [Parvularcula marina]
MIFALSLLTISAPLPAELSEALESPEDAPLPVYVAAYETSELNVTAKVDPAQPEGQRITVLSPRREDWPKGLEKQLAEFEADTDGDIWCDTAEELIGGDVAEISRDEHSISYRFPMAIEEGGDKADKAFADASHGEVDITRTDDVSWRVAALRIRLDKPFKPAMVAKVTKLDVDISCSPAANGRMYQARTQTGIEGSAFGRSFSETEVMELRSVSLPSAN